MPSSHLILCCPLFLLPPIPPSVRVFSNESSLCMRWPKYWSFSFSIIPSKEHPGLISFRMDWLDLLAVQGTLKGLDLIDRVPDELWMEVRDIVLETGIKIITMEKKCKKAKWLSGEALQIAGPSSGHKPYPHPVLGPLRCTGASKAW